RRPARVRSGGSAPRRVARRARSRAAPPAARHWRRGGSSCKPADEILSRRIHAMALDIATIDHVLTTTRSVRKRLDFSRPVPDAVIQECVDISLQSPTGSNVQGWRVMVVTDAAKRKALADLYRKGFQMYQDAGLAPQHEAGDIRAEQMPRVIDSAVYLAEHLHEAPVMVIYCIEGRMENAPTIMQASIYGSVLPAAWSFMLAARARGI